MHFRAWCQGKTGFPIVDAGMRQLNKIGYMHNRLRMIVACFLVKDLMISWQWGEKYFMQRLIDGDLASNNGGWQWVNLLFSFSFVFQSTSTKKGMLSTELYKPVVCSFNTICRARLQVQMHSRTFECSTLCSSRSALIRTARSFAGGCLSLRA